MLDLSWNDVNVLWRYHCIVFYRQCHFFWELGSMGNRGFNVVLPQFPWYTSLFVQKGLSHLASGRCGSNSKSIIFKLVIQNSNWGTCCKIALRWMTHNLIKWEVSMDSDVEPLYNTILNMACWGQVLTHWGRVTQICVGKLTNICSDNGLSPGRRQAIIWTNAGILLIEPLGTNFSEILIGIQIFSFKKMRLTMSSAKWRPFCLGLNVLRHRPGSQKTNHN